MLAGIQKIVAVGIGESVGISATIKLCHPSVVETLVSLQESKLVFAKMQVHWNVEREVPWLPQMLGVVVVAAAGGGQ